jgi:catechol 2,3-dioxygenase-like lactoylglutathione lyase family enzyme
MPAHLALDHVSLMVTSLEVSTRFYTEVLGFEPIHNGTEKSNIRWFGIGGLASLHITEGDFAGTHLKKETHFAVSATNFDDVIAGFRARRIPFFDWPGTPDRVTGRPDGFRQVYLQDPDGYWIEINDHTRAVA